MWRYLILLLIVCPPTLTRSRGCVTAASPLRHAEIFLMQPLVERECSAVRGLKLLGVSSLLVNSTSLVTSYFFPNHSLWENFESSRLLISKLLSSFSNVLYLGFLTDFMTAKQPLPAADQSPSPRPRSWSQSLCWKSTRGWASSWDNACLPLSPEKKGNYILFQWVPIMF